MHRLSEEDATGCRTLRGPKVLTHACLVDPPSTTSQAFRTMLSLSELDGTAPRIWLRDQADRRKWPARLGGSATRPCACAKTRRFKD